ncbi:hypothetical protein OG413_14110 [Streptomyces sp. NBC_01433]|uniref:hypothetical protein n=1 Tax=Streptomyces sp. NBC_01433 TaxID=2903864 RepID=UPI0022573B31|nr:hypothetical protein [Streptomyces sp. NBC_01433]MCX4676424.1 hypothetical protein [Streptomyces sp. NBC_01433]
MNPAYCVTRNHIELWNERVLPDRPTAVGLGTVLRGSLLPFAVWLGVAVCAGFFQGPVIPAAVAGLLSAAFLTGFVIRRRARHSTRCCVYGALGGVLDKSMMGF